MVFENSLGGSATSIKTNPTHGAFASWISRHACALLTARYTRSAARGRHAGSAHLRRACALGSAQAVSVAAATDAWTRRCNIHESLRSPGGADAPPSLATARVGDESAALHCAALLHAAWSARTLSHTAGVDAAAWLHCCLRRWSLACLRRSGLSSRVSSLTSCASRSARLTLSARLLRPACCLRCFRRSRWLLRRVLVSSATRRARVAASRGGCQPAAGAPRADERAVHG